jgi:hypothetical protein
LLDHRQAHLASKVPVNLKGSHRVAHLDFFLLLYLNNRVEDDAPPTRLFRLDARRQLVIRTLNGFRINFKILMKVIDDGRDALIERVTRRKWLRTRHTNVGELV